MKLPNDDKMLLEDLCGQNEVDFEKVVKLLDTVREYEFKDRRSGIYEALREILKSKQITGVN